MLFATLGFSLMGMSISISFVAKSKRLRSLRDLPKVVESIKALSIYKEIEALIDTALRKCKYLDSGKDRVSTFTSFGVIDMSIEVITKKRGLEVIKLSMKLHR